MSARIYALAWRFLPYAGFAPLGAMLLLPLFGGAK